LGRLWLSKASYARFNEEKIKIKLSLKGGEEKGGI